MGLKDFFKKDKKKDKVTLEDLTLSKLRPGYFVDWDMKTWEVAAYNYYDWGGGDLTYEWQLKTSDDTIYLEYEPDDEDFWSVCRKISFGKLGSGIKDHIVEHRDPPEEITFEGTTYYLDESSGCHFFKDGKGPGQELIQWNYEDDDEKKILCIEQWGENSFEASKGFEVEEYQFTDILPSEKNSG